MYKPTEPNKYIGKQLIGTSKGRILLNAGEDSLFFADKGFLFSTNGEIHFNTSDQSDSKFIINSPRIQLGIDPGGNTTSNAAVKSEELIAKLKEICLILEQLLILDIPLVSPVAPLVGPCAPDPTFSVKSEPTKNRITSLKNSLNEIKSDKVFLT